MTTAAIGSGQDEDASRVCRVRTFVTIAQFVCVQRAMTRARAKAQPTFFLSVTQARPLINLLAAV